LVYGTVSARRYTNNVRIDVRLVGAPNGTVQGARSWCTAGLHSIVRIDARIDGVFGVRNGVQQVCPDGVRQVRRPGRPSMYGGGCRPIIGLHRTAVGGHIEASAGVYNTNVLY